MGRVIFHIDLNAYFANAEKLKDKSLINKPIAVSSFGKRSVICAASYEARVMGVNAAMPVLKAKKKCPELVIVDCDFDWYEKMSEEFFNLIKTYTPLVEPASIDECYVDVSKIIKNYERPMDLAWQIQQRVLNELGLPCSIGVGPNKFLAKMASDMKKPLGITILRKRELKSKLWPLAINEMYGIGKKSAPLLIKNEIKTIGDLADAKNESKVLQLLGPKAYFTIQNARGEDKSKLETTSSLSSISVSRTYHSDIEDLEELYMKINELANELSHRARESRIKGKTISLAIRYEDFSNIIRSTTISKYINSKEEIYEVASMLFEDNYSERPVRHLGIHLGNFFNEDISNDQLDIFVPYTKDIIEELNEQLSDGKLIYASKLLDRK